MGPATLAGDGPEARIEHWISLRGSSNCSKLSCNGVVRTAFGGWRPRRDSPRQRFTTCCAAGVGHNQPPGHADVPHPVKSWCLARLVGVSPGTLSAL